MPRKGLVELRVDDTIYHVPQNIKDTITAALLPWKNTSRRVVPAVPARPLSAKPKAGITQFTRKITNFVRSERGQ